MVCQFKADKSIMCICSTLNKSAITLSLISLLICYEKWSFVIVEERDLKAMWDIYVIGLFFGGEVDF